MESIKKCHYLFFVVNCGKIQGQFVISLIKTEIKMVSELMSMLVQTVIVENASLCSSLVYLGYIILSNTKLRDLESYLLNLTQLIIHPNQSENSYGVQRSLSSFFPHLPFKILNFGQINCRIKKHQRGGGTLTKLLISILSDLAQTFHSSAK